MSRPITVHAGPSLPRAIRDLWPDLDWRPPAVAGDALRAEAAGVETFVVIDGLFDAECAIRHNELLRLVAAGVRVIGAASMGALRAAELHPFGVEGVGRIFEAYCRGSLVGDDEVALLHGPAELDWLAITTPLVNIRATLGRACRTRRLTVGQARRLLICAQALCFSERTWSTLCDRIAPAEETLRERLEAGTVDLKRLDALAALDAAQGARTGPAIARKPPPDTVFSRALARVVKTSG